MNTKQFEDAHNMASPYGSAQAAADISPMFVVQYVPSLGTGGATATIALTQDGSMTFKVDSAVAVDGTTDAIGSSGVIDTSAAAFDTVGELVDYINGRQAWRAYLAGGLRNDDCDGLLTQAEASCFGATGLAFYQDTSVSSGTAVPSALGTVAMATTVVSAERFVSNAISGHQKDADEGVINTVLQAQANIQTTGASLMLIISGKQGSVETVLYSATLTDATLLALGRTGSANIIDGIGDIFMKSARGERLIVRCTAATSIEAVDKFEVTGKSAVLSGAHMSSSVNF